MKPVDGEPVTVRTEGTGGTVNRVVKEVAR